MPLRAVFTPHNVPRHAAADTSSPRSDCWLLPLLMLCRWTGKATSVPQNKQHVQSKGKRTRRKAVAAPTLQMSILAMVSSIGVSLSFASAIFKNLFRKQTQKPPKKEEKTAEADQPNSQKSLRPQSPSPHQAAIATSAANVHGAPPAAPSTLRHDSKERKNT